METLILYATKSGASRICAKLLEKNMKNSVVCDISKSMPNIKEADILILGSGIRMGHMYKSIRNFIKDNLDILLTKRVAIYLCNAYPDTLEKMVGKDIPQSLFKKAICIKSFGGIPPFSTPKNHDWIYSENIKAMIEAIDENN